MLKHRTSSFVGLFNADSSSGANDVSRTLRVIFQETIIETSVPTTSNAKGLRCRRNHDFRFAGIDAEEERKLRRRRGGREDDDDNDDGPPKARFNFISVSLRFDVRLIAISH